MKKSILSKEEIKALAEAKKVLKKIHRKAKKLIEQREAAGKDMDLWEKKIAEFNDMVDEVKAKAHVYPIDSFDVDRDFFAIKY